MLFQRYSLVIVFFEDFCIERIEDHSSEIVSSCTVNCENVGGSDVCISALRLWGYGVQGQSVARRVVVLDVQI